ncbi:MAG: hypothetical protein CMB97_08480 [Flavobacteriaceae bacterium]|nr:hypothetical protein [Flavobacteriaceae bacterium]
MNILQENWTDSPVNQTIFIYIKIESGRVEENKYLPFHEEMERLGEDDIPINPSFHLSKSNRTGYEKGFTNQPNYRSDLPDEKIEYTPVSSVSELYSIFQKDISGTLFKDNYRGLRNFIQSDVLCLDVDNDEPSKDEFWDDESNWITIDSFSEMFKDYTFILSTSRNHMKEKGGRCPRPKFHVVFPLSGLINDPYEHTEMLEKIDYMTLKDDRTRIDRSVGNHSQIYGNRNTTIYFNSGVEGSISGLLYKDDFTNNFRGYKNTVRKSRTNRQRKGGTNFSDIENLRTHSLTDWDYKHIISKYPLEHWYEDISYQPTRKDYLMGRCGLPNHPDEKPSLQIFPLNSGFNCLGCGESHGNPLVYIGLKTGRETHEVRKEYCNQLGLDITDYTNWLDKKNKNDSKPSESTNMKDEKVDTENDGQNDGLPDPFPHEITTVGDYRVNDETYKELEKINSETSLMNQSGKVSMLGRGRTSNHDFKEYVSTSIRDFKTLYSNQKHRVLQVSPTGKETVVFKDVGDLWEMWKDRRQYDGIDFNPTDEREDYFDDRIWDVWDDWESGSIENDWKGDITRRGLPKFMNMETLNVITQNKDFDGYMKGCSKYLEHIQRIICGNYKGNTHKDLVNYILGWMTKSLTQHGRNRTKVSLCFLGGQGSGKGCLISNFGEIFGQHFLKVSGMYEITHNFNIHMMDKVLVYINECLFGGDRKDMNRMKDLITEDTMVIEGKHQNSFTGKNHMNFMVSSNEDFVVPVEHDGRRYMVLDISNEMVGNRDSVEYFTPLFDEWRNGGKEHFFKYITHPIMKKKSQEINYEYDRPHTTGRSDQLLQTEPLLGYFHNLLVQGGHRVRDPYNNRSWTIMKWNESEKKQNLYY